MKIKIFICIMFFLPLLFFSNEPVIELYKQDKAVDFLEKMNSNEVFVKWVKAIDVDNEGKIYLLDIFYCQILKLDPVKGSLIKKISSKGQGPMELHSPLHIRVKGNRIFVVDKGFGGVKIFDINGKFENCFRTKSNIDWLDINDQNQIFIKEFDTNGVPIISEYNIEGVKKRTVIEFKENLTKKKESQHLLNSKFIFKLDCQNNLYVLHVLKRKLRKYDQKGTLKWEADIKNRLLDKFLKEEKKIKFGKGNVKYSRSIFGIDFDENGNIFVGHAGGGAVLNNSGVLKKLIVFDPPANLDIFKIYKGQIFAINTFGRSIKIHKIMK